MTDAAPDFLDPLQEIKPTNWQRVVRQVCALHDLPPRLVLETRNSHTKRARAIIARRAFHEYQIEAATIARLMHTTRESVCAMLKERLVDRVRK